MPPALRVPSIPMGLSEIAEEFKRLDCQRRQRGLSLGEAEQYHALFARLSDALDAGWRHRRVDERQFLRVPFPMTLFVRLPDGVMGVACHDFGGGGCALSSEQRLDREADVWLDGAELAGEHHPLHGRATVIWERASGGGWRYGLRFCLDAPYERDQIDRLFFRVLDCFLRS